MQKILIADSSEINKPILYEVFASQYELLTAESCEDMVKLMSERYDEISLALIDKELAARISKEAIQSMAADGVFDAFPIIIILPENDHSINQQKLHVPFSDVINSPVNPLIIKKRASNLIEFFLNKKELEQLVSDQSKKILQQNRALQEQQRKINTINNDMLDTLSTVIEYRDVESGRHIHRIRRFTEVLLRCVAKKSPRYNLTEDKIQLIVSASSLHDIGKIAIPDSILLCPRRLTFEEFRIMKQHTVKGCEILDQLDAVERNEYFRYCYDICRYHHEKWDGMGYPDGLVGDQIPIWAQVVSIADCYDALTSERPYKSAYSHEQDVDMIRSGACGAFSDEMMECFGEVLGEFKALAQKYADVKNPDRSTAESRQPAASKRKEKNDIYAKMDRIDLIETIEHQSSVISDLQKHDREAIYKISDIVLEFDLKSDMLHERKGTMKDICGYVPKNYEETVNVLAESCTDDYHPVFLRTFRLSSIMDKIVTGGERIELECMIDIGKGGFSSVRCYAVPIIENDELEKIYFIMTVLSESMPDHHYSPDRDIVTGLWNYTGVKREIDDYIASDGSGRHHALVMIDIDDFRTINRQAGYRFGNDILCDITNLLKFQIPGSNILGRIEDDNFVIFIKDCPDPDERNVLIQDIFNCIHKSYIFGDDRLPDISASVGIALYPDNGVEFETLFDNASKAVELAKLNGKNMFLYYNENMRRSFELKKYDSTLRIKDKNDLGVIDYEEYFIPVADSVTDAISSYDMLGLSGSYMSDLKSIDCFFETSIHSGNMTAMSLNNLKNLFSSISELESSSISMPELSVFTMFDSGDTDSVITAFEEMTGSFRFDRRSVCIMISHDMVGQMKTQELTAFVARLRAFDFKVGVYNVGSHSISVNCFIEHLFDKIVFAGDFIRSVADDVYNMAILSHLIRYFNKLGVRVLLPAGISFDFISVLRSKTDLNFGYHKDEIIPMADFRLQMNAASFVREYPVLEHQHNELVLNEKMYDEILRQTKSFIIEWSSRFDKVKVSGSFENMYGYRIPENDFLTNISDCDFIHNDDKKKLIEKLGSTRYDHNETESFIRVFDKHSDDYIWNRVRFVTFRNSSEIVTRIMAVFTDISDSRCDIIDEQRKGRTDFITSLYNKHATENKIKNYLYDEGSSGTHAFLIAEICGFEVLERELGSAFANAVLKEAAQNVRELFRDSDIIGRNSGNRFIVFVKGMNVRQKIIEKAEQICKAITNKYQAGAAEISVYGKVGISIFPNNGSTYDDLYSAALKALYYTKHDTNSSIAFISDINGSTKLLHD